MSAEDRDPLVARIPADVEMPDKVLANLTVRQVVILAGTGLLAAWVYLMAGDLLPLPVLVAVVFPVVAAGFTLAMGRRDGVSLDRLLSFGLTHVQSQRMMVMAPEGVHPPPPWCRLRGKLPAPLRLPVRAIRQDGVMDLTQGGTAVVVRAGTVSFGLRTPAEQAGLISVFAGWLNSLDAPVQILLQARPVDLCEIADQIARTAPRLADPALEQAALDHAEFLAELNVSRDLLTREVLIVIRHDAQVHSSGLGAQPRKRRVTHREASAAVVLRRADEAARSLAALGVTAAVLNATEVRALLIRSFSPGRLELSGLAMPDKVISFQEDPQ